MYNVKSDREQISVVFTFIGESELKRAVKQLLYKPPSGREGDRDNGGRSTRNNGLIICLFPSESQNSNALIPSESQNSNLRFYSVLCQSHESAGYANFRKRKLAEFVS